METMASKFTNTVRIPLTPATLDFLTARAALEMFGEIAHAGVLPAGGWGAVAFYDVRAAAAALLALAPLGCIPGPQSGSRTVELDGTEELNVKECKGISGMTRSKVREGAFTIEFFDIRDAQRCRDATKASPAAVIEAPPGLAQVQQPLQKEKAAKTAKASKSASPQKVCLGAPLLELPPGLPLPPGLEEEVSTAPSTPTPSPMLSSWLVVMTGIPNKLLSKAMLEAMLQQAGLDGMYDGLTIKTGKPASQVSVCFSTPVAAQRCATHFKGCRWDKSGAPVCAEIFAPTASPQGTSQTNKGLNATAPVFQPSFGAGFLSAKAPEFVPSAAALGAKTLIIGSDTSTDVGESEDEKCPSVSAAATA